MKTSIANLSAVVRFAVVRFVVVRFVVVGALTTVTLAAGTLAAGTLAAGCTSFAFKQGGKGTAPSELQDRDVMPLMEGGTFQMGSQIAEPDEFPAHKVSVSRFLIDKTEVTLQHYGRCVEARVCRPVAASVQGDEPWVTTELHPVTGVSWNDARKYCDWVGKRLPTEAEWEYAARRPQFGIYPWPGAYNPKNANSRGEGDGFPRTAPVGSFPGGKTSAGLVDMAGNAAEWTADWYESTFYQKSPERDPKGPEAPTGSRSVRGGSWADPDHLLRSTARFSVDPNVSNNAVGFRCAATP